MAETVSTSFKENEIDCPCGCGTYGVPAKGTGHPKKCPNTCPKCRGKRNRERGKRGERDMRKVAGVKVASIGAAMVGEEAWSHRLFRDECKAGKQVEPIATRFLAAEAQSDGAKRIGDTRVFRFLARPDRMPRGIVSVRGEVWEAVVEPALEAYYGTGAA